MALHPLAIFIEGFCSVVEAPLRAWNGRLDQSFRGFEEGVPFHFHIVYAGQTEEWQLAVAPDAVTEHIIRAIVVFSRVVLEEIVLGIVKPPTIHRTAEFAMPVDNFVEAAARFILDGIQIGADVLDCLAERVTVRETDQRECSGAVSDTLPASKFPRCVSEGSEVLYGIHFRNAR